MKLGKGISEKSKSVSEGEMSTVALVEAKSWADALHDAEYRGRKDTDGAARYRLAKRLGLKENYLFRLQYRAAEMKDVAGEVYRRLKMAHDELCERIENSADRMRTERLEMEARRHAALESHPAMAGGTEGAAAGAEREVR